MLRLLSMGDRDKTVEILALRHQIMVLERQLGKESGAVRPELLALGYPPFALEGTPAHRLVAYCAEPATPEHDAAALLDLLTQEPSRRGVDPGHPFRPPARRSARQKRCKLRTRAISGRTETAEPMMTRG